MSAVGLESFEHTVQLTHIWINELDEKLDWENKARSYRLLKAVLNAVRDWLQVNEAADLGAQLPMLLRGAYYDQWRPARNPAKPRGRAAFIARVQEAFDKDPRPTPKRPSRPSSTCCRRKSAAERSRMSAGPYLPISAHCGAWSSRR